MPTPYPGPEPSPTICPRYRTPTNRQLKTKTPLNTINAFLPLYFIKSKSNLSSNPLYSSESTSPNQLTQLNLQPEMSNNAIPRFQWPATPRPNSGSF